MAVFVRRAFKINRHQENDRADNLNKQKRNRGGATGDQEETKDIEARILWKSSREGRRGLLDIEPKGSNEEGEEGIGEGEVEKEEGEVEKDEEAVEKEEGEVGEEEEGDDVEEQDAEEDDKDEELEDDEDDEKGNALDEERDNEGEEGQNLENEEEEDDEDGNEEGNGMKGVREASKGEKLEERGKIMGKQEMGDEDAVHLERLQTSSQDPREQNNSADVQGRPRRKRRKRNADENATKPASQKISRTHGTARHREDCGCVVCEGRRRRELRIRRYGRDITKKELDKLRRDKKKALLAKSSSQSPRGPQDSLNPTDDTFLFQSKASSSLPPIGAPVITDRRRRERREGRGEIAGTPRVQETFEEDQEEIIRDPDPVLLPRKMNSSVLRLGAILFSKCTGALLWKNRNQVSNEDRLSFFLGTPRILKGKPTGLVSEDSELNDKEDGSGRGGWEGRGGEERKFSGGAMGASDVENAVKELLTFRGGNKRGREAFTLKP